MTTTETLVRDVVATDYSGMHSVKVTETIEVGITWPDEGEPRTNEPYSQYGEWRIVRSQFERREERDRKGRA